MEDLNDKVLGGNLAAVEWNQVPSELQNIIEDTGQALTNADLNQLGKGVADYVGNNAFYTDSGAADAYVLTSIGSTQSITAYTDGLTVEFLPANTNAGSSTVNAAAIGVKNIVNTSAGGELVAGEYVRLKFRDGTDDFIIDPSSNSDVSITGGDVIALHENLICTRASVSTVDIDANAVLLKTDSGKKFRAESVDVTVDITAGPGINGIDTGSEASSTWYNLWVISDGTTVGGLLSTSSTSPTLPTGFIYKGLVGAAFNDSGSDFLDFYQRGRLVNEETVIVLDDGGALSFASVDLSNAVPPIATSFSGDLHVINSTTGTSRLQLSAVIGGDIGQIAIRNTSLGTDQTTSPYSDMIIKTSQTTFYQVDGVNQDADIHVSGFKL